MGLAKAASVGLGMPNLQVAPVPGHPGLQSKEVLQSNIREVTLAGVVDNLLKLPAQVAAGSEPGARDVVCRGTFEEINDYFIAHELSDGLPIVPPTVEKSKPFCAAPTGSRTRCWACCCPTAAPRPCGAWRSTP